MSQLMDERAAADRLIATLKEAYEDHKARNARLKALLRDCRVYVAWSVGYKGPWPKDGAILDRIDKELA